MKVFEITTSSRKTIKKLQNLYLSYILNNSLCDELIKMIDQCKSSNDSDIAKEAALLDIIMIEDMMKILKK